MSAPTLCRWAGWHWQLAFWWTPPSSWLKTDTGIFPSARHQVEKHSREAAARIGKSSVKSYAGTLFAGFTTLPEIPQNDVVAQFGIPRGDFSLDVQDGQSVHAAFVRRLIALHAHGTSWYFDHASVAALAGAGPDSPVFSRS